MLCWVWVCRLCLRSFALVNYFTLILVSNQWYTQAGTHCFWQIHYFIVFFHTHPGSHFMTLLIIIYQSFNTYPLTIYMYISIAGATTLDNRRTNINTAVIVATVVDIPKHRTTRFVNTGNSSTNEESNKAREQRSNALYYTVIMAGRQL